MHIKSLVTRGLSVIAIAAMMPAAGVQAQDRASPELVARVDGVSGQESQTLKIERIEVKVTRRGSLANTEITIVFNNPTAQTLEGQFGLTLPTGSVVTGYALDVNGVLIDGVLQGRDRARKAFERRVAVQVDPGLAEVNFSDRFETRVYPILPQSSRTIRIRFVSPLDADGNYELPLEADKIGQYALEVRGIQPQRGQGLVWFDQDGSWKTSGQGSLDTKLAFGAVMADGMTVSEHP